MSRSVIFYVAEIAVIAALVDIMVALSCLRERLVLGLATFSFLLGLAGSLAPRTFFAIPRVDIQELQLFLWLVASLVSVTIVYSALRVGGVSLESKGKK